MLLLSGCLGTITLDGEREPVRGALYYELSATEKEEFDLADVDAALVVIANSTFPCEPDDVDDDPTTSVDEVGSARTFWLAQIQSAFAREGAMVAGFIAMKSPDVGWTGNYFLDGEALADSEGVLDRHRRFGTGFWWHVEEAEGGEDEVLPVNVPTETEDKALLDDPDAFGIESLESSMIGDFAIDSADVEGTFEAEECTNADLEQLLYSTAVDAGLL